MLLPTVHGSPPFPPRHPNPGLNPGFQRPILGAPAPGSAGVCTTATGFDQCATMSTMSATPATNQLNQLGVQYELHEYEVNINDDLEQTYGEAVADAIGASPEAVFKTLVASVDTQLVVAIVPVSGSLSLKGLARAVGGKKAVMADPSEAERATAYVVGGISPFGQKKRLPILIDESVVGLALVYVSGGRRGLQISLTPADLVETLGATVADIAVK